MNDFSKQLREHLIRRVQRTQFQPAAPLEPTAELPPTERPKIEVIEHKPTPDQISFSKQLQAQFDAARRRQHKLLLRVIHGPQAAAGDKE